MEELIKITENDGKKTVSARELHKKLQVKTGFAHWFNRMCEYGFVENVDYTVVKKERGEKGQFAAGEYYITLEMAKEICMIQRSEIGKKFRQYFIDCENKLRTILYPTIQTRVIDSAKEKEVELARAEFLHSMALEYHGKSETYKQVLDAYATKELVGEFILPLPKVEKKSYSASEVGKLLGISGKKVGSIANKLNLKSSEFGCWYHTKAAYSNKELDTFRYFDNAIEQIKKHISTEGAES